MTDEINKKIGELVRKARKERNFSMSEVCDLLPTKISAQQLAKYETGISRWPVDLVTEIADAFKINITELIQ